MSLSILPIDPPVADWGCLFSLELLFFFFISIYTQSAKHFAEGFDFAPGRDSRPPAKK